MKIELNEKEIQDQVSKAIVESAIGKTIIKSINEHISGYRAHEIIDDAIGSQVKLIIRQVLLDDFSDIIKEKMKEELLKDDKLKNLVTGFVDKLVNIDWNNL